MSLDERQKVTSKLFQLTHSLQSLSVIHTLFSQICHHLHDVLLTSHLLCIHTLYLKCVHLLQLLQTDYYLALQQRNQKYLLSMMDVVSDGREEGRGLPFEGTKIVSVMGKHFISAFVVVSDIRVSKDQSIRYVTYSFLIYLLQYGVVLYFGEVMEVILVIDVQYILI